jgi:hypothetical protein
MCLKFDHDLAKRSLSSLLILALWALAPLEAHAQTAEDTVAHMLYGVRDGAQQFSVSTDFSGGRIQAKKAVLQGVWKREDNGLFVAHIQTGRHSSVLRIVVRRLNYCTFTALVSSRTDDPDYDDENLVTANFSKVSSIIYRADQKEAGLREFSGPLRVTVDGENAICVERRFDLSSPKPKRETTCHSEGQHLFPTALPFFGLTRPLGEQEAAVSLFKLKFCGMRG